MPSDPAYRLLGLAVLVLAAIVPFVLSVLGVETLASSIGELALIAVGAMIAFGVQLVLYGEKAVGKRPDSELISRALVPSLDHLTLYFSTKEGPKKPKRPYYVVNDDSKQAYYVDKDVLELCKR